MGEAERVATALEVYGACRISDTLFAMNPFLTQQNFYSQQLRALALVEIIDEFHLAAGRRNVVVVGAGVAGRTLAAAFASVGATVRLVEAREKPFERYQKANHRELHPNIIFWPAQDPTPGTALPFMNWAQSSAKEVVEDLMLEWKESFGNKVTLLQGKVKGLSHADDGVTLQLNDGGTLSADLCVLAMGFKDERTFGTLKSPGYWSPASIVDEETEVLVSGSGDGGLIDVLSPILGTDVTRAAHVLAVMLGDSAIKEDVAKVEADREANLIAGTRDSTDTCTFYERVQIPPDVSRRINEMAESKERLNERKVTLLFESTSAFSFTAAPINKLLLSHFGNQTHPVISTVRGSMRQVGPKHEMETVAGATEPLDPPTRFDKIMVRHGADPGVIDILQDHEVKALKEQAGRHASAAAIAGYDRAKFHWGPAGMGRSGVQLSAMEKVVRRMLARIGRAYEIDITLGKLLSDCFTGDRPIEVSLSVADRRRADALKLFPLRLGPATVEVRARKTSRNAPYDL